jgi:hypothetical protein
VTSAVWPGSDTIVASILPQTSASVSNSRHSPLEG